MPCPTLIRPACIVVPAGVGHLAGDATGGAIGAIAGAIQSGVDWMVAGTVDWWVKIPSPDLASEPAVGALQRWLLPVTVAVAVLAMIAAAGKMAVTRKANPLMDVGSGLAIIAATSAVGVLLPAMLLKAGDAWSSWVLQVSTGGQFGSRLAALLTLTGAASGVVLVLGIVAIILTAIQAVLMLFRQAALVILAGVLPLAAAGTLTPATRAWFRRVTGWMLALIFYKPAAAAVYATAFTMIGRGHDPRTILMGFAMVALSLVALPALMKFFTWTTGAVETTSGGGFLGTLVSGAIAVGALRASSGGPGAGQRGRQPGHHPRRAAAPGPLPARPGSAHLLRPELRQPRYRDPDQGTRRRAGRGGDAIRRPLRRFRGRVSPGQRQHVRGRPAHQGAVRRVQRAPEPARATRARGHHRTRRQARPPLARPTRFCHGPDSPWPQARSMSGPTGIPHGNRAAGTHRGNVRYWPSLARRLPLPASGELARSRRRASSPGQASRLAYRH